jgi:hypothetical protein
LTLKYHEPLFDLQKFSDDVNLSGLVRREDIVAAVKEVINKFDFSID